MFKRWINIMYILIKQVFFQLIILLFIFLLPEPAFSGTSFTITPNTSVMGPFVDFNDIDGTQSDYSEFPNRFFSLNNEYLATGMALSNTLGYPNGKSTIRPFPHFEFGAAAGGSIYHYSRKDDFNKDDLEANPTAPGGGANAAIHLGTGITDRFDLTLKFFSLKLFYSGTKSFDKSDDDSSYQAEIDDYNAYSIGIKGRYNLIRKRKKAWWVFSPAGLSINLALDYMENNLILDVDYSKTVTGVEFAVTDPFDSSNNPPAQTSDLTSVVNGSVEMKTSIFSITPEILGYLDVLYLFSFYTGPSLSINMGTMEINARANGTLTNSSAISVDTTSAGTVELVGANEQLATAELISNNTMKPKLFIPKWTLGLELNFLNLKVQLEATAILISGITDSIIGQAGVRFDF
jgi:hypothetical protein